MTGDSSVAANRRRNVGTFLITDVANDCIGAHTTAGATRAIEGWHKLRDTQSTGDNDMVPSGSGRIAHIFIKNNIASPVLRVRWTSPPPVCSPVPPFRCSISLFKLKKVVCNYQLWEV
jgi:hypothetical protein